MSSSQVLVLELGTAEVQVTVTDPQSFLGTLRNMTGVADVSKERSEVKVRLDEGVDPETIVNSIWHIYESRAKVYRPGRLQPRPH